MSTAFETREWPRYVADSLRNSGSKNISLSTIKENRARGLFDDGDDVPEDDEKQIEMDAVCSEDAEHTHLDNCIGKKLASLKRVRKNGVWAIEYSASTDYCKNGLSDSRTLLEHSSLHLRVS